MIRKERRNGRDLVIVPSATMPDNIIMNRVKYPADEISKSFGSLEKTPAPFGHPMINGQFVSASDPEGINLAWIGAWNEDVRRENGRVFLNKVIDVEVANRTPGGKAVLEAIDKGEPIHTSTGLLCVPTDPEGDDHDFIARDIVFDHDAILLGEAGAATPDQGVGMLVNGKKIPVINSALDYAEEEIDRAGMWLVEALARREKVSSWEKLKSVLGEALGLAPSRKTETSQEDDDMAVTDEQFAQLSAQVKTLADSLTDAKVADLVANAVVAAVKPLTDQLAQTQAANAAKEEAEKTELVNKVVKGNLLTETVANSLTVEALRELAPKAEPGKAAALNGAYNPGSGNAPKYTLPKGE